jgi:hypothetical protein
VVVCDKVEVGRCCGAWQGGGKMLWWCETGWKWKGVRCRLAGLR